MSVLVTGFQIINLGSCMNEWGSSCGEGSVARRKLKSGWASWPFTSILAKTGNFGINPPPGRTYFRQFRISDSDVFSWNIFFSNRNGKGRTQRFKLRYEIRKLILKWFYSVIQSRTASIKSDGGDIAGLFGFWQGSLLAGTYQITVQHRDGKSGTHSISSFYIRAMNIHNILLLIRLLS